ncbi:MAG: hypothetical protein RIT45_2661 [Pseudomonadota bacterium]|jgi:hypothetical protein
MIVEHVRRDRHPKDIHHVLRYGDLEGLLPLQDDKQWIYLSAHFGGAVTDSVPDHRQSRRSGRQRAGLPGTATYFQLCRLHFHPDASRVVDAAGTPWETAQQPTVVFADVMPVAHKVSEWFPTLKAGICEVLGGEIRQLVANGYSDRWLLHVALLPESAELEIGRTTWSDLLRNDEKVWRVALS